MAKTNKHIAHNLNDIPSFGFWLYLLTDLVLFGCLFMAYVVLKDSTFGGPSGKDIFDIKTVMIETALLLTSSLTSGLALVSFSKQNKNLILGFMLLTFILGLGFIFLEVSEFTMLIQEGHTPRVSGFLSAFFTLVGTHGLHVTAGLIWLVFLFIQIVKFGTTPFVRQKFVLFNLFWHFLDLIWIFVFSIVYLIGVL